MKNLLFIALFLVSTVSFAAHGPAGCGIGALMFKGKDGLVFHILAATFNGSSGNQTFGMSTGTLGCETANTTKVSAVSFVEANTVALANDIARGNGETLGTYLSMIQKENANTETLRKNYSRIFASGNTPQQIHNEIISSL